MSTILKRTLVIAGLLSLVLHAAYLVRLFDLSAATGVDLWASGDTGTYLGYADALVRGNPPNPVYRERVLLPLLIAAFQKAGAEPQSVLWVVVLLEPLVVYCLGFFAWKLFGNPWIAGLSALAYVFYPNSYGRGGLVDTDMLHAQLTVVALTATFCWWKEGRGRALAGAIPLWILLQLLRPTMYLAVVPLAILAIDVVRRYGTWRSAVALIASLLVVPTVMASHNWRAHDVASPSLLQAENLWVWMLPRIKTEQRNLTEPAPLSVLFAEEQEKARSSQVWKDFHNHGNDISRVGPAYRQLIGESKAFMATNTSWVIRTCWTELRRQVSAPPQFYLHEAMHKDLRSLQSLADSAHILVLLLLPLGVAYSLRQCAPAWILFMVVFVAMIMGPATIVAWWQGSKYRLLADVIVIPWIVLAAVQPLTWGLVAAFVTIGYFPRRFLGAPAAWFTVSGIVLCAIGSALVATRSLAGKNRVSNHEVD